jgi:hypothetical protein
MRESPGYIPIFLSISCFKYTFTFYLTMRSAVVRKTENSLIGGFINTVPNYRYARKKAILRGVSSM